MNRQYHYPPKETFHHLIAPYILNDNNWGESVHVSPYSRNNITSYECITCHSYISSEMKFLETVKDRNQRIRQWQAIHQR